MNEDAEEKQNNIEIENKDKEETTITKIINKLSLKSYVKSKLNVFYGFIFMLALILYIIDISRKINPDYNNINPNNILVLDSTESILLTLTSSILYLLVLFAFTRLVFFDKKESFGVESYKSARSIWFFLLTISFLSQIFILLDTALINIYLITGPAYFLQSIANYMNIPITSDVDRLAYANIRSIYFTSLLFFNLLFPLFMFLSIFSRYGRKMIKKTKETDYEKKYTLKKLMKFIIVIPIIVILFAGFNNLLQNIPILASIMFIVMIVLLFWWLIQLVIIISKIIRFTVIVSYSNLAMILPIFSMFYIFPIIIWGLWDLLYLIFTGSIDNTIYNFDFMNGVTLGLEPSNITNMNAGEMALFLFQTIYFNSKSIIRIVQLDFIFIIGIASIVIGFAQGYTIFALFQSISKGTSIVKSGKLASQTTPRLIILTKNILVIITWISIFYDKFIGFWSYLRDQFNINLPNLNLPIVFIPIVNFTNYLASLSPIFLPLTILLIPFYFIILSSFKFLSVSIAAEKTHADDQVFFLLISSAFVLIVIKIFSDISLLPEFLNEQKDYLPLLNFSNSNMLNFVMKITELLETLGFFTGFITSVYLIIKNKLIKQD